MREYEIVGFIAAARDLFERQKQPLVAPKGKQNWFRNTEKMASLKSHWEIDVAYEVSDLGERRVDLSIGGIPQEWDGLQIASANEAALDEMQKFVDEARRFLRREEEVKKCRH